MLATHEGRNRLGNLISEAKDKLDSGEVTLKWKYVKSPEFLLNELADLDTTKIDYPLKNNVADILSIHPLGSIIDWASNGVYLLQCIKGNENDAYKNYTVDSVMNTFASLVISWKRAITSLEIIAFSENDATMITVCLCPKGGPRCFFPICLLI